MPRQYDWDKLRPEFVAGDMSLADFARQHEISYSTLMHRSSDDKKTYGGTWPELQDTRRVKEAKEALEKIKNRIPAIESKALEFYEELIAQAMVKLKAGKLRYSAKDLAEAHKMLRLVCGEATGREEHHHTGLENYSDDELYKWIEDHAQRN